MLYLKSRIFGPHLTFVCRGSTAFRTHEINVQPLTAAAFLTCFEHSYAFYFGTEAAVYEIYENKMDTKYSGFTVRVWKRGELMRWSLRWSLLDLRSKVLSNWLHSLSLEKVCWRHPWRYSNRYQQIPAYLNWQHLKTWLTIEQEKWGISFL